MASACICMVKDCWDLPSADAAGTSPLVLMLRTRWTLNERWSEPATTEALPAPFVSLIVSLPCQAAHFPLWTQFCCKKSETSDAPLSCHTSDWLHLTHQASTAAWGRDVRQHDVCRQHNHDFKSIKNLNHSCATSGLWACELLMADWGDEWGICYIFYAALQSTVIQLTPLLWFHNAVILWIRPTCLVHVRMDKGSQLRGFIGCVHIADLWKGLQIGHLTDFCHRIWAPTFTCCQ